jgi:aspartate beta-hydroxylase
MVVTSLRTRPRPSLFSYAGLDARPFWDPSAKEFPWLPELEASTAVIREELLALRASEPRGDYDKEGEETSRLHEGPWRWHSYVLKGKRQARFAASAPETARLLGEVVGADLLVDLPVACGPPLLHVRASQ